DAAAARGSFPAAREVASENSESVVRCGLVARAAGWSAPVHAPPAPSSSASSESARLYAVALAPARLARRSGSRRPAAPVRALSVQLAEHSLDVVRRAPEIAQE